MCRFDAEEMAGRLARVRARMQAEGIDVLLLQNPASMNYLTGYDAWSFYEPQAVLLDAAGEPPIWIGRPQDANSARLTTRLGDGDILTYPEQWIEYPEHHPAERFVEVLKERGWDRGRIGVEGDAYCSTPRVWWELQRTLEGAEIVDADLLVSWVRSVKSDAEIECMREAAEIAGRATQVARETIRPGIREGDVVAEVVRAQILGTPEYGGAYPAIYPILLTGRKSSSSHTAWSDARLEAGNPVVLELAGCRSRYHAALCRTFFLGTPPDGYRRLTEIVGEAYRAAFDAIRPGVRCEDVEAAWREVLTRHGMTKESRLGYTIGLGYPPNWGERTASLRAGDRTPLLPNMTFHLLGGLWLDPWGYEVSETIRVTEQGVEALTSFERGLLVRA
ncbi:MAG: M24 family metallopeptidase [Candidatus Dormibacteraceae bacterium]